jgi:hypothetical protein
MLWLLTRFHLTAPYTKNMNAAEIRCELCTLYVKM